MRLLPLILCLLFFPASRGADSILSQSHQFAIYMPRPAEIPARIPAGSILVEPQLLAVSAERVREALATEIPALNSRGQRIHIHIMDTVPADPQVGIVATKHLDGWTYRVAVPPVINELRLIKGLIKISLLEFSNRSATEKGADLPDWIHEGLAQQLYYSVGPKLVVNRAAQAWEITMRDFQARTRQTLATNDPPSFNNVTTLLPPPSNDPAEAYYQGSVHLLVHSLLKSRAGPQRFGAFLQLLPHAWNWQTAFRQAFGFESMLDAEKWWALAFIEFTSRDQRQAWSRNASLQKLDELLKTRIEIRAATNALPQIQQIELQSLLQESDWALLRPALNEKLTQLTLTAPHFSPPVAALAIEYKNALENFLNKRQRTTPPTSKAPAGSQAQTLAAALLKQLNTLDNKRRTLAEASLSSR